MEGLHYYRGKKRGIRLASATCGMASGIASTVVPIVNTSVPCFASGLAAGAVGLGAGYGTSLVCKHCVEPRVENSIKDYYMRKYMAAYGDMILARAPQQRIMR